MYILAVDPGREKCGLAVMRHDGKIFYQEVVETARLSIRLAAWYANIRRRHWLSATARRARLHKP